MPRKRKTEARPPEPARIEFETFQRIDSYQVGQMKMDEPSCFNGDVMARKYRVTVELVEEPPETIGARLQEMWDLCNNYHHWYPLKAAAKEVGWELKGQAGNKIDMSKTER